VESSAALASSHGDRRPFVMGRLLAMDTATNRAQVTIDGSQPTWLPFIPGVYDRITTVYVLTDPERSGSGQLVIGPCYQEAEPPPAPPPPPSEEPPVTATALIRPVGSGTYRHIRSAWDRWNVTMYGGATDLYQGDAYGSGPLTGLAWYGDQVVNLQALEITAVSVATPLATGSGNVVLQGAPHASRPAGAPAPAGDTVSGGTSVTLTAAMREALRTGSIKSLATVGANYRGTYGAAHPSGLSLSITYTRPA
jgi:hypothetical protein